MSERAEEQRISGVDWASGPDHVAVAMWVDGVATDVFRVEYRDDHLGDGEPCIVAVDPDLPGCYGFGPNEAAALERLIRARQADPRTALYPKCAVQKPAPPRSTESETTHE